MFVNSKYGRFLSAPKIAGVIRQFWARLEAISVIVDRAAGRDADLGAAAALAARTASSVRA